MFGRGNWIAKLVAVALLALAVPKPAHAGDRIADLTQMLSSSSEKTRISAVLSLARLNDKSSLKPLVTALHDPSAQVRAIAATALGKLGHKAALPALKTAATDDVDETVRAKAGEAAAAVAKLNHLDDSKSPAEKDAAAQARVQQKTSGFGRSPHAVTDRPDLFVTVKGANDDSPGTTDKATRKVNADLLKTNLQTSLAKAPQVTMTPDDAARWGLDVRSVDVSVVKLELSQDGNYMVMAAELRLAISDDKGKMISFLSGGAKVQIPRNKYSAKILPNMRKDALEGAMQGMFDKLLAHLRQITTT
jgi:hypothetical protein